MQAQSSGCLLESHFSVKLLYIHTYLTFSLVNPSFINTICGPSQWKRFFLSTSPFPSPWSPLIYLLSLQFGLLIFSTKWDHIMCGLLRLIPFTLRSVYKSHRCHGTYQSSIPLYSCIIFHGIGCTTFCLSHLSVSGLSGCFHFLAIMNNAAVNFHVHLYVWTWFNSVE